MDSVLNLSALERMVALYERKSIWTATYLDARQLFYQNYSGWPFWRVQIQDVCTFYGGHLLPSYSFRTRQC